MIAVVITSIDKVYMIPNTPENLEMVSAAVKEIGTECPDRNKLVVNMPRPVDTEEETWNIDSGFPATDALEAYLKDQESVDMYGVFDAEKVVVLTLDW